MEFAESIKKFHIAAIKRGHDTFIPNGKDYIKSDDILYFTVLKEDINELPALLEKKSFESKNIMIMGGSRITMRTIQQLPSNVNIKVIERDREKAEELAGTIPSNVTVFHADGRDSELLLNEGITEMDAFISLTDNSETNILSCIMAKQFGIKKTVAEIENIDYISMAEKFDIGTIINKKLLAASKIYEILLKADASNIKCLAISEANVGEVVAKPNSKVTKKQIKDLKLPTDITFGALTRNGKPMLIEGETQIEANDQVMVFFMNKTLKTIENLFN